MGDPIKKKAFRWVNSRNVEDTIDNKFLIIVIKMWTHFMYIIYILKHSSRSFIIIFFFKKKEIAWGSYTLCGNVGF